MMTIRGLFFLLRVSCPPCGLPLLLATNLQHARNSRPPSPLWGIDGRPWMARMLFDWIDNLSLQSSWTTRMEGRVTRGISGIAQNDQEPFRFPSNKSRRCHDNGSSVLPGGIWDLTNPFAIKMRYLSRTLRMLFLVSYKSSRKDKL